MCSAAAKRRALPVVDRWRPERAGRGRLQCWLAACRCRWPPRFAVSSGCSHRLLLLCRYADADALWFLLLSRLAASSEGRRRLLSSDRLVWLLVGGARGWLAVVGLEASGSDITRVGCRVFERRGSENIPSNYRGRPNYPLNHKTRHSSPPTM